MTFPFISLSRSAARRTALVALLVATVAVPIFGAAVSADEPEQLITITGPTVSIGDLPAVVSIGDLPTVVEVIPSGFEVTVSLDALVELPPFLPDFDRDGVDDDTERALGLDPSFADSDRDGLGDGLELRQVFGNTNPLDGDSDADGLGDGDEIMLFGTDPLLFDTDFDGYADLDELVLGRDPRHPLR